MKCDDAPWIVGVGFVIYDVIASSRRHELRDEITFIALFALLLMGVIASNWAEFMMVVGVWTIIAVLTFVFVHGFGPRGSVRKRAARNRS